MHETPENSKQVILIVRAIKDRGFMPSISDFFGIIIWMYYDEREDSHVEYESS